MLDSVYLYSTWFTDFTCMLAAAGDTSRATLTIVPATGTKSFLKRR